MFHWSSGIFMPSKISNLFLQRVIHCTANDQQVTEHMDVWMLLSSRQGIFQGILSVTTNCVFPLTEALGHFTEWFSTPNNHTTPLAMHIIQQRASFLKTFSQGNVISKPDFVQERNTCHWLFPSLNVSACKVFLVPLPFNVRNNKEQEKGTKSLVRPHYLFVDPCNFLCIYTLKL